LDPVKEAADVALYVKTYGLDGVDVDYEDFGSITAGTGGELWVIGKASLIGCRVSIPEIRR
jgi:chitinase